MRAPRLAALLLGVAACGVESDSRHPGIEAEAFLAPPRDALTVCAAGPTVSGVDVSKWDGTVTWGKVAAAGWSFAITKATEGVTYEDPSFVANWAGIKSAGLVRGAYHFYRPQDNGTQQADFFLSKVGAFAEGDLPPILDWEVTDSVSNTTDALGVQDFVGEVQARTGLTTIVYTSRRFLSTIGNPTGFGGLPLWDAWWQSSCPDIPDAWATWTFWQYSSTVWVPGINGGDAGVDVNYFNGTQEQLLAFAGVPAVQPDAGTDAGLAPDAGADDAGAPDDAGAQDDAGAPDAGTDDAGIDTDGGVSDDAGSGSATGLPPRADGGASPPLATAVGCNSSGSAPEATLPIALLMLAAFSRARRKPTTDSGN